MRNSRCILAKRMGGDRIEVFQAGDACPQERPPDLESELRRALARDEITCFTSRLCGWRTVRSQVSRR